MAKQVIVSFSRTGASGRDSAANFLAGLSEGLNTTLGDPRTSGMLARSPWSAAHAIVDDADNAQDAANAMAQAVFDQGVTGTFAASVIASTGVITELAAPTPV